LLIGAFAGSDVPVEMRALAREFDLGGVTFFDRLGNIESAEQVADLSFQTRQLGQEMPAWVAIDQEGGRVARLRSPFTEWPPMAVLGRSEDPALAKRFAEALATELAAVGISLDFAPVLDIHTNPKNAVIGDRALSEKPELVARLGRAIIEELQRAGVAACGKHFPGHGDTVADSHLELPIVEHPPDRLRAVEFVPFRAAIEAGAALIMTAHVRVTSIDEDRPATLSKTIVHEILRLELGFDGLIVSDDLSMKAIAATHGPGEAAVAAIAAGCDAVLINGGGSGIDVESLVNAVEALIHAVEDERLPLKQVEAAMARNRRAKERFIREWRPPTAAELRHVIGSDKHQAISDEMAAFA
jgi:beta-N-acetylhexosaminidase